MNLKNYPKRGDIIIVDLSPTSGREQKGLRPCVVLSHYDFNSVIKMAYICAVTSKIRGNNFEVAVDTEKTKGVALTHQVKVIDLSTRKFSIVDQVSDQILEEILKKIKNIIE